MSNNKFVDTKYIIYLDYASLFLAALKNYKSPEYGISLKRFDGTESFFAFDSPEIVIKAYETIKELIKMDEGRRLKKPIYFITKLFKDVIRINLAVYIFLFLLWFLIGGKSLDLLCIFILIMFLVSFNWVEVFKISIKLLSKPIPRDQIEQKLSDIGLNFFLNDFDNIKEVHLYIKNLGLISE